MKRRLLASSFLIIFFSLLFSVPGAVGASTQAERERLTQIIQILQQEVRVLQSLMENMQSSKNITARSYVVVNLSTNTTLLEKNTNILYPIASVTKLMNAVIVREQIKGDPTITLTEPMLRPLGHSPTLFKGLNVSVKNLLQASLIQSTNDASEALAHVVGKETFVILMNQKAKELEMESTVFYDAHGLNLANQSTALDLVKLARYVYQNHPEILQITRENDFWLPDATGRSLKFMNMNNFYPLSSFVGGKTGYLPEAKQTLVSIFQVNGDPLAIIVLSSSNRQADVFAILRKLKE
ncbi:MAG: serine hydrolase [bacterium]|nr:serine hydrolase [bacterium]